MPAQRRATTPTLHVVEPVFSCRNTAFEALQPLCVDVEYSNWAGHEHAADGRTVMPALTTRRSQKSASTQTEREAGRVTLPQTRAHELETRQTAGAAKEAVRKWYGRIYLREEEVARSPNSPPVRPRSALTLSIPTS